MFCYKCKSRRAYYNLPGETPIYCSNCKDINMINTFSKKCEACNLKIPTYNFSGLKAKFCKDCKLENMINVVNKICSICNFRRASFQRCPNSSNNLKKNKSPIICKTCIQSNESINKKNKSEYKNVVVKLCVTCKKKPAKYNNTRKRIALYCVDCKPTNSFNVRTNICTSCNSRAASFNTDGEIARYCNNCKQDNMIDVRNKYSVCQICLKTRANPKYSQSKLTCARCFHSR